LLRIREEATIRLGGCTSKKLNNQRPGINFKDLEGYNSCSRIDGDAEDRGQNSARKIREHNSGVFPTTFQEVIS